MTPSNKPSWRQAALLAVPVLLLLIPVGIAARWIYAKQQWGQEVLASVEPRYARLLGLQSQQEEIQQMLERFAAIKAQHVYPGENGSAQTGNAVQQNLRSALGQAGLTIVSSQVQAKPGDDPFERIDLVVTAEGDLNAVQLALVAVRALKPTLWLEDITISLAGQLENNSAKIAPKLNAQFTFSVLRGKVS